MKLIQLVCLIFLFLFGVFSCSDQKGNLSKDKALQLTHRAIAHYQLTELPLDCLQFEEKSNKDFFIWVVHETHNEKCGGDPRITPRFFEIRTDRKTGQILTDAQSIPGEMLPPR